MRVPGIAKDDEDEDEKKREVPPPRSSSVVPSFPAPLTQCPASQPAPQDPLLILRHDHDEEEEHHLDHEKALRHDEDGVVVVSIKVEQISVFLAPCS